MSTTEPTEAVKQGIDLEKFHEFVEYATANPEDVQMKLGARAPYEGRLFHSLAKVDEYTLGGEDIHRETREYTLPLGAWREVEEAAGFVDPTDRMEPIEVALAALTGCLNVVVGVTALANDIELDELETTVRLDFDPRVVLMIHDVDRAEESFGDIDVEIAVSGENLSEADADVLAAGAKRSPVWSLMNFAHDMDPAVTVGSTSGTAD
ncbi:OsmC family protein [Halobacterium sp. R2-5]|uniref:OsmC family protein n=1 Tax=Halobacterium sp. R2-5 TaxID=2715751 RepID=UPI00142449A5|nr:OsmC family protein [Halobacterium sp. R2-5]NIC00273.1 OsmC family protein [Halobacterium sp. R2-5]